MQRLKRHATISWNSESRQIRILSLLPGQWDDPIECRLRVSSLDDDPHYETISYAWGDPNDKRAITVENGLLEIPASLELALRHLRKVEEPLALWADAICIDQSHREEKAHQVGLMGAIFSNCSSVNIWLGIPDEGIRDIDPFILVNQFADNGHIRELPGFSFSEETQELTFEDNKEFQDIWAAFDSAMSHPWWSRLWCVQESILPPAGTIIRGRWRAPWRRMKLAAANHQNHLDCCSLANSLLPPKYVFNADHLLGIGNAGDSDEDEQLIETLSSLERVLRLFRHKECKDPRDRIYGLMGLLNLGRAPLKDLRPDYTVSARSVFMKAMKLCIAQSPKDLTCLTGSGLNSEELDLPSWAINFATPLSTTEATVEQYRIRKYISFDASAGMEADIRFLDDDILALRGFLIDEIVEAGEVVTGDVWRDPTWVLESLKVANRVAGLDALTHVNFKDPIQQAFWKTMLCDGKIELNGRWSRMTPQDHESLQKWLMNLLEFMKHAPAAHGTANPEANYTMNTIQAASYGRAFCRTKQDRFSLCYPTTRPGDQVWILAGGTVPFILRPSELPDRGEASEGKRFRLIGECYCQGVMDGEAVSAENSELEDILLL